MKKRISIILIIVTSLLLIIWVNAFYMWNKWMMMWWNNKLELENLHTHDNLWLNWENGTFDKNIENLKIAKKTEIVELKDWDTYEMVASAVKQEVWGRMIKRLAYNGMIPWPLLKVQKWAKIKIKLTNKLWIETTLHSHWLRLDNSKMDWVPTDMNWEQVPMKIWESFTYELNFPDTWVFWYHPHIREDYTQEMGLYGNFSVNEEKYWNEVDNEKFLILDDFSEDDVFHKWFTNKTMRWRYWNLMMINNDENYKLKINSWETTRLFITNTANTRTFDFKIVDKNWKKIDLKLVGWDIWRIEKEVMINSQIIAPAERYIIEVKFNVAWIYYIVSRNRKLWEIIVKNSWKIWTTELFWNNLRTNFDDYKNIRDNLWKFLSKKADKNLRLTLGMKGAWEMRRGQMHKDWKWEIMWWTAEELIKKEVEMWWKVEKDVFNEKWWISYEPHMEMMNRRSNSNIMEWNIIDNDTTKSNMEINWKFKKWDFVKIKIYNDIGSMHPMQHPIHFHWQRFVVLTRDGKINKNFQWKDTTLVRAGETVEILVEMTNVWLWMTHCHIAEHLQSWMMFNFRVEEK